MTDANPMRCPRCGAAMNHHADKPHPGTEDTATGDGIEALYACPACGEAASRHLAPVP